MPQVGADGDVVDITLHTVKVQNFDKTIVSIPTWRLMSESFKNQCQEPHIPYYWY